MQKYIKIAIAFCFIMVSRFLPFNYIIGSTHSFFSWTTMCAPVIAFHCGYAWVGLFLISFKSVTVKSLLFHVLHRLPLFCAARAFSNANIVVSCVLPLLCIVLFIMHPTGAQAWIYAMYWFIPIIFFFAHTSLLSNALQASFVAHAVGSVIWLYTGSIASSVWLSLIPIVAVERLAMAGAIMICHELYVQSIHMVYYAYKKWIRYKVME